MATIHETPTPRRHRSTYVSPRREVRADRVHRSRRYRLAVLASSGGAAAALVVAVLLPR
ncbi:hypothetical protein [Labedella populi]|uniref:hypothetical protein n=1 Tax=Labedella populi TaxID=2498850 RepID=UPI00140BC136|nr:hypothetical protein [Labedella populi]